MPGAEAGAEGPCRYTSLATVFETDSTRGMLSSGSVSGTAESMELSASTKESSVTIIAEELMMVTVASRDKRDVSSDREGGLAGLVERALSSISFI
jgi:hypothetical protein